MIASVTFGYVRCLITEIRKCVLDNECVVNKVTQSSDLLFIYGLAQKTRIRN
jgi:hypothetical protein